MEGNTIHAFFVRKVRDQAAVLPVPDAASLGAVLGSRTKVVVTEVKAVCSMLHFLPSYLTTYPTSQIFKRSIVQIPFLQGITFFSGIKIGNRHV